MVHVMRVHVAVVLAAVALVAVADDPRQVIRVQDEKEPNEVQKMTSMMKTSLNNDGGGWKKIGDGYCFENAEEEQPHRMGALQRCRSTKAWACTLRRAPRCVRACVRACVCVVWCFSVRVHVSVCACAFGSMLCCSGNACKRTGLPGPHVVALAMITMPTDRPTPTRWSVATSFGRQGTGGKAGSLMPRSPARKHPGARVSTWTKTKNQTLCCCT